MRVKIGPYIYFLGPYQLAEKLLFWKDKEDDSVKEFGKKLTDTWIGDYLEKRHEKKKRKVMVHIDDYDVWSLDTTLAMVIYPALLKLKANKRGAPFVDDEDVPEHLRSIYASPMENGYGIDDLYFSRYEWVLDELIWAFGQQAKYNEDEPYPYDKVGERETEENPDGTYTLISSGFKRNPEKFKLFEEYHNRKNNAFRLFGKYYNSLWD